MNGDQPLDLDGPLRAFLLAALKGFGEHPRRDAILETYQGKQFNRWFLRSVLSETSQSGPIEEADQDIGRRLAQDSCIRDFLAGMICFDKVSWAFLDTYLIYSPALDFDEQTYDRLYGELQSQLRAPRLVCVAPVKTWFLSRGLLQDTLLLWPYASLTLFSRQDNWRYYGEIIPEHFDYFLRVELPVDHVSAGQLGIHRELAEVVPALLFAVSCLRLYMHCDVALDEVYVTLGPAIPLWRQRMTIPEAASGRCYWQVVSDRRLPGPEGTEIPRFPSRDDWLRIPAFVGAMRTNRTVLEEQDFVKLAIRYFNKAYAASDPRDAVIMLCIALESLLVAEESGGKKHKIAARTAAILENDLPATGGLTLPDFVGGAYDLRNEIVHTNGPGWDDAAGFQGRQDLARLANIVAHIILRLIAFLSANPTIRDKDGFVRLLDDSRGPAGFRVQSGSLVTLSPRG